MTEQFDKIKDSLGKAAYDAYCETRAWKSYNGDPLPQWVDVRLDIKVGWVAAARAVVTGASAYIEDSLVIDMLNDVWKEKDQL
jgi:hypothetical protein